MGCSKLISITIPNSVTSISHNAFLGCSEVVRIYYKGSTMSWKKISFVGAPELYNAKIYCYSENEPTEAGNYWHYDVNGKIAVWI